MLLEGLTGAGCSESTWPAAMAGDVVVFATDGETGETALHG